MTVSQANYFGLLPDELKLYIFEYAENPLLIQQVCRDWNRLGHDPKLFLNILKKLGAAIETTEEGKCLTFEGRQYFENHPKPAQGIFAKVFKISKKTSYSSLQNNKDISEIAVRFMFCRLVKSARNDLKTRRWVASTFLNLGAVKGYQEIRSTLLLQRPDLEMLCSCVEEVVQLNRQKTFDRLMFPCIYLTGSQPITSIEKKADRKTFEIWRTPDDERPNVIRKFMKNKANSIECLNLSNGELSVLPKETFLFTKLKILLLENNELNYLPPEITQLNKLEELNLSGNFLSRLHDEITQLKNLRILNLSNNLLETLSTIIGKLTQLRMLDVSGNRSLPANEIERVREQLPRCQIIV